MGLSTLWVWWRCLAQRWLCGPPWAAGGTGRWCGG
ncbi:hypothetical protein E2C01_064013 [Portunus trituberculatus]|uniref:Uncharacterized protein n=1 Tax=Portunus trituberculatus TaxID=210409 RepID=A0A5B7HF64_PORTR|nr:hypothetical protein [Portunus trituberculatus]